MATSKSSPSPPGTPSSGGGAGSTSDYFRELIDLLRKADARATRAEAAGLAGTGGAGGVPGSSGPVLRGLFEESQYRLGQKAAIAGGLGFHGVAGTIHQAAAAGRSLNELGAGGLGAAVGKLALPFAIGRSIAHAGAGVASVSYDETLTNTQMTRGLAKQIPVLKEALGLYDLLSGRVRDMARVEEERQRQEVRVQRDIAINESRFHIGRETTSAQIRANVTGGATAVEQSFIDRRTAAGEKEYQIASKILPVRQEIASAEREAVIAAQEQQKAGERYNALISKRNGLQTHAADLEARLSEKAKGVYRPGMNFGEYLVRSIDRDLGGAGNESGPQRQQLLYAAEQNTQRIEANERLVQEAARDRAAAERRKAEADARVQQARVAEMQARAEIKQGEIESAQSVAQRLGGAGPVGRQFGIYALQHLQKFGPDSASPEIIAAAQGIAPRTTGKLLETYGAQTGEYAQLQKIAPLDVAGGLEDLRKEHNEMINNISKANLDIQKSLTDATAKALEPLGKMIVDSITFAFDAVLRRVDQKIQLMKNSMH